MLAGTLMLGGAGLVQAQDTGGSGAAATAEDQLATAKQLIGKDENGFLQRLHHANKMEIELGQLALQKSSDNDVKQFGQRMVTEHTAADQSLQAYAQKKGVTLSDSEPSPENDTERAVMETGKAMKKQLEALQGKAFQYAYLTHMVGDHDLDVSKVAAGMEQYAANKELTTLLQSLGPKLTQHRERAYDLLGRHKARVHQARSSPKGR